MIDDSAQSPPQPLVLRLRQLPWPVILAGLAVLGLLIAFYQVVSGAVRQGEQRRAAVALHSDGLWRCNAIPSLRLRNGCLGQLAAAPHDEAMLRERSAVRGSD